MDKQKSKERGDFRKTEEVIICPVCASEWNVIDNFVDDFYYCPKCGQRLKKQKHAIK